MSMSHKRNLAELLDNVEKMQENLRRAHAQLANREIEGETDDGLVKVIMNGRREVLRVELNDAALHKNKKELENLIQVACNNARKNVERAWIFEAAFSDKLNS